MLNKLIITLAIFFSMQSFALAEVYTVKSGDTLYGMLSNRYAPIDITSISNQIKAQYSDFILKVGMKYLLEDDRITINASYDRDIIITTDEQGIPTVTVATYDEHVVTVMVSGEIEYSLFESISKTGETAELASKIATIFEWEIDFLRDIRKGDSYNILVEKRFVNNKYAGYGKVVAADFVNQGKVHRAIYFNEGKNKGYYSPDGKGLERGFLRVPLSYSRISSRFSSARLHPVLNEVRPHYGVDYAAPTGTPIMATAAGVVEKRAYDKANGNYVVLRHSNGYRTYYLHMSRFNKSVKKGVEIDQGQVVGYVGSTGYSTGPHLDYRIKKNNSWINPLTFEATPKKLTEEELVVFFEHSNTIENSLDKAYYIMNVQNNLVPTNSHYLMN